MDEEGKKSKVEIFLRACYYPTLHFILVRSRFGLLQLHNTVLYLRWLFLCLGHMDFVFFFLQSFLLFVTLCTSTYILQKVCVCYTHAHTHTQCHRRILIVIAQTYRTIGGKFTCLSYQVSL